MKNARTVLILGATGGIGGAIAEALLRHGWSVRGMARDAQAAQRDTDPAIAWHQGDAMNRDDVIRAATGVSTIVHAVNPPGYRNWATMVLPMIDNTIAAARAAGGARIVLPSGIYNFNPATTPVIRADSPQAPNSRKGAIRVELERRLEAAAREVPSLILRAGDFFGPGIRSSWFSQAMIAPHKPLARVVDVARGPGHSWAYLPDLAETFARLLDISDQLSPFEVVQFEGVPNARGTDLSDALDKVAGRTLPHRRFPWWLMRVLAPFGGFPREAAELAPYWRHPVRLDNQRLIELLGAEPHTPLDQAMVATLRSMGSLPAEQQALVTGIPH
ncbi:MAG: NAD(P)H-binding protein [Rhodanobacter sp.]